MKTKDEIAKIKASLLYILTQFPEGVDFIKLFKIMYFAQQEHLVKYGRGIMEDSFYALKHGPVPSFTYKAIQVCQDKIKDSSEELKEIAELIVINGNIIYANGAVDMDELSISDRRCMDNAISAYKDVDSFHLSELSHDTAWEEAYMRAQDDPEKNKMTLIEIAKAGKAKQDIIDEIRESEIIKRAFSC